MAFIRAAFQSMTLMREMNIAVILPPLLEMEGMRPTGVKSPETKFKTLYLLHGLRGNEMDWVRLTGIERYAYEKNLAVVMPAGDNFFYANGPVSRMGDFVGRELVEMTRLMFPLSLKREDTFVAGLSMGGYGAIRTFLNYPETFRTAASLSGAVDMAAAKDLQGFPPDEGRRILEGAFGDPAGIEGSENDLFHMTKRRLEEGLLPELYVACGTEDFLYGTNVKFRDHLKAIGAQVTYEEGPGGHTWDFWDTYIRRVLHWLPL